jgi:hypothetical protein
LKINALAGHPEHVSKGEWLITTQSPERGSKGENIFPFISYIITQINPWGIFRILVPSSFCFYFASPSDLYIAMAPKVIPEFKKV